MLDFIDQRIEMKKKKLKEGQGDCKYPEGRLYLGGEIKALKDLRKELET